MVEPDQEPLPSALTLVGRAWGVFGRHFGVLFLAHLVFVLVIQTAFGMFLVPGVVVLGPLWYGLCRVSLAAARGRHFEFRDAFKAFDECFGPTAVAGTIMFCVGALGFLLIFTPVVIVMVQAMLEDRMEAAITIISLGGGLSLLPPLLIIFMFGPAFFVLIDESVSATEALRQGAGMVIARWNWWGQLWFWLSLIHLAGIIPLGLGLLIATPWMIVALALAYDAQRGGAPEPPPAPVPPPPPPLS